MWLPELVNFKKKYFKKYIKYILKNKNKTKLIPPIFV